METPGRHRPVLLQETLGFLRNGPGLYLDATLGEAGHARALLEAEPEARLLGCDRDPAAVAHARGLLATLGVRVIVEQARFRDLPEIHRRHGGEPFAGALFDLGLSSRQLDDPERGMSFMAEGPLDLRMDPGSGTPAAEALKRVEERELAEVLRRHGEVPRAAHLARAISGAARAGRLETTSALVATVERCLGGRAHPRRLAQVFQALRRWVNEEAEELEAALSWLPAAMRPGGVVVTIAFHSLEDRTIKQALRGIQASPRRLPPLPTSRPAEGPWETLTRHVVTPTSVERASNPRSRSARLRAFRRRTS